MCRAARVGDDMETFGWFKNEFEEAKDSVEFKLEHTEILLTEKILERMTECGISRSDLAKKMKTSKAYISKLFNNGSNMTLKSMLALAEAVGCSLSIDLLPNATDYRTEHYTIYQIDKYPQVPDEYFSTNEDADNVAAFC